jgi:hypothetical protein
MMVGMSKMRSANLAAHLGDQRQLCDVGNLIAIPRPPPPVGAFVKMIGTDGIADDSAHALAASKPERRNSCACCPEDS